MNLAPGEMDNAGMYVWAGLITALTLVASYFVALWWQRRRDGQRSAGKPPRGG